MARYRNNDPRWIVTKYASKAKDGTPIAAGTRAFYFPLTKTLLTGDAADAAASRFESERQDEAFLTGGY